MTTNAFWLDLSKRPANWEQAGGQRLAREVSSLERRSLHRVGRCQVQLHRASTLMPRSNAVPNSMFSFRVSQTEASRSPHIFSSIRLSLIHISEPTRLLSISY